MPPKVSGQHTKKHQRVRVTNKAMEARQFSTVRLPRQSEVKDKSKPVFVDDVQRAQQHRQLQQEQEHKQAAPSTQSADFDPIRNDGMFVIVQSSKLWPPPPLVEGDHAGMDQYDRRGDDAAAAKQAAVTVAKVKRGEVRHPRNKPASNARVVLDEQPSDDAADD